MQEFSKALFVEEFARLRFVQRAVMAVEHNRWMECPDSPIIKSSDLERYNVRLISPKQLTTCFGSMFGMASNLF
jgi:hypothetical protein